MSYDPGSPKAAVRCPDGSWSVDSFRSEAAAYRVDLAAGTCTCPHFEKRLAGTGEVCKHIMAAQEAERFARLAEKAAKAPTETLEALLPRYEGQGRLDIALAIRGALQDRQAAEGRDLALKAVFA